MRRSANKANSHSNVYTHTHTQTPAERIECGECYKTTRSSYNPYSGQNIHQRWSPRADRQPASASKRLCKYAPKTQNKTVNRDILASIAAAASDCVRVFCVRDRCSPLLSACVIEGHPARIYVFGEIYFWFLVEGGGATTPATTSFSFARASINALEPTGIR